jgi:hypothetical protein
MAQHEEKWAAPAPMWALVANDQQQAALRTFHRPAILRFASDTFMEDFMSILERDPAQLNGLVARPETWRGPMLAGQTSSLLQPSPQKSGLARKLSRLRLATERARKGAATNIASSATTLTEPLPLKLYQPAHQRHYLVSASLVCGLTGLPDRRIDAGREERASFVVRRLLPPAIPDPKELLGAVNPETWDQYAFVITPRGPGWVKATDHKDELVPGEEQSPLFPVSFTEDDGRRRRLLAGVIPVGKREQYMGASNHTVTPGGGTGGTANEVGKSDPRMIRLYQEVTEPWKRLIEQAYAGRKIAESTPEPPFDETEIGDGERGAARKAVREQIQTASWYILLDFDKFLKDERNFPGGLPSALNSMLEDAEYKDPSNTATRLKLSEALNLIEAEKTRLEAATKSYTEDDGAGWPALRFTFADIETGTVLSPEKNGNDVFQDDASVKDELDKVEKLAEKIRGLLSPQESNIPSPLISQKPFDMREGWFVIRCVFERPHCGPLDPPLLSDVTEPFQMAGFFDPDAPARPIRIALPIDTTPAGLRKFDRNTAFMISDVLCGQIDRVQGMTLGDLVLSVLPWPFHKGLSAPDKGPCDEGQMCSLSLPIITICALLLLMIIVTLLDIIFHWIPFFRLCFELPGFKAKR